MLALVLRLTPAMAQQFSADLVADTAHDKQLAQKIYVANGRVRIETAGAGALIVDGAAHRSYMLIAKQKIYMEMRRGAEMAAVFAPADPENPCPEWQKMARSAKAASDGWSCHRIGSETVNGRSTVKFEAEAADHSKKGYVWIDPTLKFIVRTAEADGKASMELKNIKEGTQPADLFVIPADYQKMDVQQMIRGLKNSGQ